MERNDDGDDNDGDGDDGGGILSRDREGKKPSEMEAFLVWATDGTSPSYCFKHSSAFLAKDRFLWERRVLRMMSSDCAFLDNSGKKQSRKV